eukprot:gene23423-28421_t
MEGDLSLSELSLGGGSYASQGPSSHTHKQTHPSPSFTPFYPSSDYSTASPSTWSAESYDRHHSHTPSTHTPPYTHHSSYPNPYPPSYSQGTYSLPHAHSQEIQKSQLHISFMDEMVSHHQIMRIIQSCAPTAYNLILKQQKVDPLHNSQSGYGFVSFPNMPDCLNCLDKLKGITFDCSLARKIGSNPNASSRSASAGAGASYPMGYAGAHTPGYPPPRPAYPQLHTRDYPPSLTHAAPYPPTHTPLTTHHQPPSHHTSHHTPPYRRGEYEYDYGGYGGGGYDRGTSDYRGGAVGNWDQNPRSLDGNRPTDPRYPDPRSGMLPEPRMPDPRMPESRSLDASTARSLEMPRSLDLRSSLDLRENPRDARSLDPRDPRSLDTRDARSLDPRSLDPRSLDPRSLDPRDARSLDPRDPSRGLDLFARPAHDARASVDPQYPHYPSHHTMGILDPRLPEPRSGLEARYPDSRNLDPRLSSDSRILESRDYALLPHTTSGGGGGSGVGEMVSGGAGASGGWEDAAYHLKRLPSSLLPPPPHTTNTSATTNPFLVAGDEGEGRERGPLFGTAPAHNNPHLKNPSTSSPSLFFTDPLTAQSNKTNPLTLLGETASPSTNVKITPGSLTLASPPLPPGLFDSRAVDDEGLGMRGASVGGGVGGQREEEGTSGGDGGVSMPFTVRKV